jgi:hypothetical protein
MKVIDVILMPGKEIPATVAGMILGSMECSLHQKFF